MLKLLVVIFFIVAIVGAVAYSVLSSMPKAEARPALDRIDKAAAEQVARVLAELKARRAQFDFQFIAEREEITQTFELNSATGEYRYHSFDSDKTITGRAEVGKFGCALYLNDSRLWASVNLCAGEADLLVDRRSRRLGWIDLQSGDE